MKKNVFQQRFLVAMASTNGSGENVYQTAPVVEEEVASEGEMSVHGIQSRYLRCPSPR